MRGEMLASIDARKSWDLDFITGHRVIFLVGDKILK